MDGSVDVALTEEDAFHFIVRCLREARACRYSNYGYDLYLPGVMDLYVADHGVTGQDAGQVSQRYFPALSPAFYAAAWTLCRRGVLRPGVSKWGTQSTPDGSAGNGYSVTPFGRQWLAESDRDDYVPSEPGRFAAMLSSLGKRFGAGYQERAQEAMRCYGAHAYLACCAMCGAAAESLILALAIAGTGDEAAVLADYSAKGGRGRVENLIVGQQPKAVQEEFRGYSSLLKYWRDNAAHGQALSMSDSEAYTSLAVLLRFSQFANDRWDALAAGP